MLGTPNNLYLMTNTTSVANSGLGSSVMTKPAGTEVASIMPGVKYSNYIPSAATFTTDFNADSGQFTIVLYAKPEEGLVVSIAGNEVFYSDNTFTFVNEVGERLSVPFTSHRAHLIILTYSDYELGLYVDGHGDTASAKTSNTSGPMEVSLLESGGVIGRVEAFSKLLSNNDIRELADRYLSHPEPPPEAQMMFDTERDLVSVHNLPDISVGSSGYYEERLHGVDCNSFKFEFSADDDADVFINGYLAHSGITLDENPYGIIVSAPPGTTLSDISITSYVSGEMGGGMITSVTTSLSSGTPAPTHTHDNNSAAYGDTEVSLDDPAKVIGGWFIAEDGMPLPGVTMSNGVLTGSNLYVNGKSYSGQQLEGWYFLVKTGDFSDPFTIDVPVHAIVASPVAMTASEIDDMYETFFGNPVLEAGEEGIDIDEDDVYLVSTEWSIVASG